MTSGDSGGGDEGRERGLEASGDSGLTGGSSEGEVVDERRPGTSSIITDGPPPGRHFDLCRSVCWKKK